MKVIYKDSVKDALLRQLHEAKRDNRTIDYIILSPDEHDALRWDLDPWLRWDSKRKDEKVRTLQLENPDRCRGGSPYVVFPSFSQFNGIDLFVVPTRYMPA